MPSLNDLHIRDPYLLLHDDTYYLYGTVNDQGFSAYRSDDLTAFDGPHLVFEPPAGFWANRHYWAPEVHRYRGRFYLFGSVNDDGDNRASQIFAAEHPLGPFVPHSAGPITPRSWPCLDATLYVDEEGTPWTVFCREFMQTYDGEMYAMPLTPDLTAPAGEPSLLFKATEAPWVIRTDETAFPFGPDAIGYITDGPYLFRLSNSTLGMLWSSFCKDQYTIAAAYSASGKVTGPWVQEQEPLLRSNGGHGMLFHDKAGRWLMPVHEPNHPAYTERPVLYEVEEREGKLEVKGKAAR